MYVNILITSKGSRLKPSRNCMASNQTYLFIYLSPCFQTPQWKPITQTSNNIIQINTFNNYIN